MKSNAKFEHCCCLLAFYFVFVFLFSLNSHNWIEEKCWAFWHLNAYHTHKQRTYVISDRNEPKGEKWYFPTKTNDRNAIVNVTFHYIHRSSSFAWTHTFIHIFCPFIRSMRVVLFHFSLKLHLASLGIKYTKHNTARNRKRVNTS